MAVMLPLATVMSAVAIAAPVAAAAPSKKHAPKAPSLRLQNKQQAEQLHPLSERRFPSQPLVQGAGQATAIDAEGSDRANRSFTLLAPHPDSAQRARMRESNPQGDLGLDDGDRIRHRILLTSLNALLEVQARSESFQDLQIFDNDKEKESFSFSLRRSVTRSPQSEFSLSFGFSYLDESLLPPSPSLLGGALTNSLPSLSLSTGPTPLLAATAADARQGPASGPPRARPVPPSSNSPSPNLSPANLLPSGPPSLGPPSSGPPSSGPSLSSPPLSGPSLSGPPLSGPLPLNGGDMRTGVLNFAQNYRRRDEGGRWLARSQFNLGTEFVDSPVPMGADAQFFSWLGRLERTQFLGQDQQLTLRLETQLSPNNLLPPHQFKMKDRRFDSFEKDARPTDISGNNGIRLHLEDRLILLRRQRDDTAIASLIPFLDLGYSWGQGNARRSPQQFLGRTGLGLLLQPLPGFDIQLDYLTNWGDLDEDTDTQNLYMTLGYRNAW
ncbi:MAG: hypothetical protein AAFV90_16425 [Cyanobacteria bacterium J06634_5]